MEWPSLAAAIGGPVVGLAGVAFGYFNGRDDRAHASGLAEGQQTHERRLAREQQLYEDLRDAYIGVIVELFKLQRHIEAAEKGIYKGSDPIPPKWIDTDPAVARVNALGSAATIDALAAATNLALAFYVAAGAAWTLHDEKGPSAYWQSPERGAVTVARMTYIEAQNAAESVMRAELRG